MGPNLLSWSLVEEDQVSEGVKGQQKRKVTGSNTLKQNSCGFEKVLTTNIHVESVAWRQESKQAALRYQCPPISAVCTLVWLCPKDQSFTVPCPIPQHSFVFCLQNQLILSFLVIFIVVTLCVLHTTLFGNQIYPGRKEVI